VRDPLTGLYDRRYLDETLPRELARAARASASLAVLLLDVLGFRRFNERNGREAGDAALRTVGAAFAGQCRKGDICCRFGGEEFAIVLPGALHEQAAAKAEALRASVQTTGLALAIGIAVFPQHGDSGEALLAAAARALYQAKRRIIEA
jgi:diguanylate cyclase (GGDEF)-like protein